MTQRIVVAGEQAWLKRYPAGRRRLRLGALDATARRLGLDALRPPPHHGGDLASSLERRRIGQLAALGVHVPEVIGEGRGALLLSDMGPTLSSRLRENAGDPERTDAMVSAAIAAITDAHRQGAYLGQPWPRNMTYQDGKVGFLDFEEDPLDVMPLEQAQARDWLLFAHGTTRFYRDRPEVLAEMLRTALHAVPGDVAANVADVGTRLRPLSRLLRGLGGLARPLAQSLAVVRAATVPLLLLVALCLGVDWLSDGDFDLLEMLI